MVYVAYSFIDVYYCSSTKSLTPDDGHSSITGFCVQSKLALQFTTLPWARRRQLLDLSVCWIFVSVTASRCLYYSFSFVTS